MLLTNSNSSSETVVVPRGLRIERVRTDRGGEYTTGYFVKYTHTGLDRMVVDRTVILDGTGFKSTAALGHTNNYTNDGNELEEGEMLEEHYHHHRLEGELFDEMLEEHYHHHRLEGELFEDHHYNHHRLPWSPIADRHLHLPPRTPIEDHDHVFRRPPKSPLKNASISPLFAIVAPKLLSGFFLAEII